jgi:hypothetical protein
MKGVARSFMNNPETALCRTIREGNPRELFTTGYTEHFLCCDEKLFLLIPCRFQSSRNRAPDFLLPFRVFFNKLVLKGLCVCEKELSGWVPVYTLQHVSAQFFLHFRCEHAQASTLLRFCFFHPLHRL